MVQTSYIRGNAFKLPDKAEQAGARISIQLANGNWELAKRIVDEYRDMVTTPPPREQAMNMTLAELPEPCPFNIWRRVVESLDRTHGITHVRQLFEVGWVRVSETRNVGEVALRALCKAVEELGLKFGPPSVPRVDHTGDAENID